MKKNKTLLMVLSGTYNLGDELISRAEIEQLLSENKNIDISVATYDKESFLGEAKDIRFFSYFPNNFKKHFFRNIGYFFRQIFEIFRAKNIIFGGGGIFFDNENISFSKNLFEWKLRLFFARLFRKKIIFWGISIEVKNPENQQKLAKIFRSTDTIIVRDERSSKILSSHNIFSTALHDSVFLMPPQKSINTSTKKIGFSLRGGFFSSHNISEIKKIIQFLEKQNYEIIFLTHTFSGDINHNDEIFVRSIFGEKYTITKTMHETMQCYQNLDFVVGMRFHSIILGAQYGIPMIVLPYGPKVHSLVELLGISEYLLHPQKINLEDFQKLFLSLFDNYEKMQDKIKASYLEVHKNYLQKIKNIDIV